LPDSGQIHGGNMKGDDDGGKSGGNLNGDGNGSVKGDGAQSHGRSSHAKKRTLMISAPDNSSENIYVRSVKIDGKVSDRNFVTHTELMRGGRLTFDMSPEANFSRGISETSAPYSFSRRE
jgi:hypothetical protein